MDRAWLLPLALVIGLVWFVGGQWAARAQPPEPVRLGPPTAQPAKEGTKFEFEVIESFDAKYEGDTPGHTGKGGLGNIRPSVALGDAVYMDQEQVGKVSLVLWDRTRSSLTIEFDPVKDKRIAVGDTVWLRLHHPQLGAKPE